MKKLDKKQIPQVVVLAVLALGLFGYFAKTLFFTGSVSAKGPAPAPAVPVAPLGAAVPTSTAALPAAPGTDTPAAPGTDTPAAPGTDTPAAPGTDTPAAPLAVLRDPFAPSVGPGSLAAPASMPAPAATHAAPPAPRLASLRALPSAGITVPAAPPLPFPPASSYAPRRSTMSLPPLPVAPSWTVTGVLQSGSDHIAILRSGDTRRFVKQGDFVDDQFRVAKVTREFVVLRSGKSSFTLPLGGAKAKSPASGVFAPAPALPSFSAPAPAPSSIPAAAPAAAPLDISRAAPARRKLPLPALRPAAVASAAAAGRPALPTVKVADSRREWRAPVAALIAPVALHPAVHAVHLRAPKAKVAQYAPASLASLLPVGSTAPDFTLPTLSGPKVSLSDLHGRVVLLHFWASWVDGAGQDLAQMRALQASCGGKGLTVLNINSWDNVPAMQNVFAGSVSHRQYDQIYDPSISNESVAVSLYHAPDLPAFYLIDRSGFILLSFTHYDARTRDALAKALREAGVAS